MFKKYIAGNNVRDAIKKVKELNEKGINGIVNYIGEGVKNEEDIDKVVNEYVMLLSYLNDVNYKYKYKYKYKKNYSFNSISLKISQFGGVTHNKIIKNLSMVTTCANTYRIFTWIDMEHYYDIQFTIDIYNELKNRLNNIGVALQANAIQKSIKDIDNASCVRLCKGAYSGSVYAKDYDSINISFVKLMWKQFMKKGRPFFAIATHDEKLIEHAINISEICEHKNFEFQMLLGIREDMQQHLVDLGYRVSVYVPYGTHVLPYMLRRCLEKKKLITLGILNFFK